MPTTVISGSTFTVKAGATDYSAQVRNGSIDGSANIVTEYVLGPATAVSATSTEDTVSVDLLYDGDSGFYMALYTAYKAMTGLAVEITGGATTGKWTGTLLVESLSASFDAQQAASCTATFRGVVTFAATP